MSRGNDGGRGCYGCCIDDSEERVSRIPVSTYEVRSACRASKSMGSSSSFCDGRHHTHQLGKSGVGYSTCTMRVVSERSHQGWESRSGGQVVMAADVLLGNAH